MFFTFYFSPQFLKIRSNQKKKNKRKEKKKKPTAGIFILLFGPPINISNYYIANIILTQFVDLYPIYVIIFSYNSAG